MFIVEFGIGITIVIIFTLMVYRRVQAIRSMSGSAGKRLILLILWFVPLPKGGNTSNTVVRIKKANSLLYVFILLFILWLIVMQITG